MNMNKNNTEENLTEDVVTDSGDENPSLVMSHEEWVELEKKLLKRGVLTKSIAYKFKALPL